MRYSYNAIKINDLEEYVYTKWCSVVHIAYKGDVTTHCGYPVFYLVDKKDIIVGELPLCNGCFHA